MKLAVFLMTFVNDLSREEDPRPLDNAIYRESDYATLVVEFLSIHYMESQSAAELAEICHLSESQLRRHFIAAYGMPPIAYRNFMRCKIAAQLLVRTDLSISEISEKVGFSCTSDFYRAFMKHHSVSPSEYRNRRR